jgi:hypothetical protein
VNSKTTGLGGYAKVEANLARSKKLPRHRIKAPTPKTYERLLSFYKSGVRIGARRSSEGVIVQLKSPAIFSFIDNPDDAIAHLNELVAAEASGAREISVDQHGVERVDLCALATFNVLAKAIKESRSRSRRRGGTKAITFAGRLPANPLLREVISVVGLPATLGIALPVVLRREIRSLGLVEGMGNGFKATSSSMSEVVATRVIDHVNLCLHGFGYDLTAEAADDIGVLTGELLNNCEDHSGRRAWWLSTYLREPERHPSGGPSRGEDVGDFHLTIFSFGDTMAESLDRLPKTALSRGKIDLLLAEHEKAGHYSSGAFSREGALTVCALQPNTSRKNTSSTVEGHRGRGTVEFMRKVARLGVKTESDSPEAVLVSGNVWVRFGLHPIGHGTILGMGASQVVAFNDGNSLDEAPDPAVFKLLKARFPGTLLSLRFNISKSHLSLEGQHVRPHIQN